VLQEKSGGSGGRQQKLTAQRFLRHFYQGLRKDTFCCPLFKGTVSRDFFFHKLIFPLSLIVSYCCLVSKLTKNLFQLDFFFQKKSLKLAKRRHQSLSENGSCFDDLNQKQKSDIALLRNASINILLRASMVAYQNLVNRVSKPANTVYKIITPPCTERWLYCH
jgi:hypothetical protein